MNSTSLKAGRNDPCPCGSGNKFKHCCSGSSAPFTGSTAPPDFKSLLAHARRRAERGDWHSAEGLFRQAVAIRPKDAFALAELGQCLCWMRRKREGLAWLGRAAERLLATSKRGDPVDPLVGLATQLQFWGEAETAGRLAGQAARCAPRNAAAHHTLALSLNRLHRNDAALAAARRAHLLAPDEPNSSILLAQLEMRQGDIAAAESRLRAVLTQHHDNESASRAWLELGHVLDRTARYDEAFDAFAEARRLEASSPQALSLNQTLAQERIAANAQRFSAECLNQRAETFVADGLPAPVFLVGFLRSGTTLTEQVLAAHPQVITGDETDILFELSDELGRLTEPGHDIGGMLERLGNDQIAHLRRYYWRRVEEEHGPEALSRTFVDKNALNCIDVGLINVVFPDARIIFAVRDPRDVILSCFMQSFGLSPVTVQLLSWGGTVRFYAEVMAFWLSIRERLSIPYRELRYEDAVIDFERQFRQLFEFLGLEWQPEVSRFHEKLQGKYISTPSFADVAKPLYASAIGRWTNYRAHFAPLRDLLEPLVARLGYS